MKYVAILDSDNELSEDAIKEIKESVFIGDEKAPYCFDIVSVNKALEQEPIFDKMRFEITGLYRVILKGTPKDDWVVRWNDCIDEVLQIVDKYRVSEEDEE